MNNTPHNRNKYLFLDSEFTGLHKNTTLISIALVSDCGKQFYWECTDYDKSQIDDWLQKNVIDNLLFNKEVAEMDGAISYHNGNNHHAGITSELKYHLGAWLKQFGEQQLVIVSDCYAYDWVLFCDIWGHAFKIPKNIYYIPLDLSTLMYAKGLDPDMSRMELANADESKIKPHNALDDALLIKRCWENLQTPTLSRDFIEK